MTEEEEVLYVEYEEEEYESSSSIELLPSNIPILHEQMTEEQITKMAMDDIKSRYKTNWNSASDERIVSDYYVISKRPPRELGFTVLPYQNNIHVWEVRLWGFEKGTKIYEDMQKFQAKTGRNYIELRVTFPPNYPMYPPFVRVVYPRCLGERILEGGAFCISALTLTDDQGWSPIYDFEGLLCNILAEMRAQSTNDPLRINFKNEEPYSIEEAIHTYRYISQAHSWKINISGFTIY